MALRSVVVVGATGLVGAELVRQLAAEPGVDVVRAITRRAAPALAGPRVEVVPVDFTRLDAHRGAFGADAIFCALGTTMRQAGSREAFRIVDHDYPLAVAGLARAAGTPHYLLVSSLGADARSRVFYNRVKGDLEAALGALAFVSLTIARPSLLLGPRAEFRMGERVGALLGLLSPPRWRPVEAARVAAALIAAARTPAPGVRVLGNTELRRATPRATRGGE